MDNSFGNDQPIEWISHQELGVLTLSHPTAYPKDIYTGIRKCYPYIAWCNRYPMSPFQLFNRILSINHNGSCSGAASSSSPGRPEARLGYETLPPNHASLNYCKTISSFLYKELINVNTNIITLCFRFSNFMTKERSFCCTVFAFGGSFPFPWLWEEW